MLLVIPKNLSVKGSFCLAVTAATMQDQVRGTETHSLPEAWRFDCMLEEVLCIFLIVFVLMFKAHDFERVPISQLYSQGWILKRLCVSAKVTLLTDVLRSCESAWVRLSMPEANFVRRECTCKILRWRHLGRERDGSEHSGVSVCYRYSVIWLFSPFQRF